MFHTTYLALLFGMCLSLHAAPDPLAILGASQTFQFTIGEKTLGTLDCRYSRVSAGMYAVDIHGVLDYGAIALAPKVELTSRLVVDVSAAPQSYALSARVGQEVQTATCMREGHAWKCEATARDQTMKKQLNIDPAAPFVVLDNNMIGHWALYLALAGVPKGSTRGVDAFVPQALGRQAYQLAPLSPATDGSFRLKVEPISEIFICNPAGKLLRIEDPRQNLVISDVSAKERSR